MVHMSTNAFIIKITNQIFEAIYSVSQEECARFGRKFLKLKYTDKIQNTYSKVEQLRR